MASWAKLALRIWLAHLLAAQQYIETTMGLAESLIELTEGKPGLHLVRGGKKP